MFLLLSTYEQQCNYYFCAASVLELVGLPSSVQSSSKGIKVSVGKQAHETEHKGDFSFPLASLRDNVNVSIHDSEGNEIAHTVVETRSIVEKGIWDDLFALQGGGHVHMRLHFNLTEHELNRIRSMRESATQRKQEDLLKRRNSSSNLAVLASGAPRLLKIHRRLPVKLRSDL